MQLLSESEERSIKAVTKAFRMMNPRYTGDYKIAATGYVRAVNELDFALGTAVPDVKAFLNRLEITRG